MCFIQGQQHVCFSQMGDGLLNPPLAISDLSLLRRWPSRSEHTSCCDSVKTWARRFYLSASSIEEVEGRGIVVNAIDCPQSAVHAVRSLAAERCGGKQSDWMRVRLSLVLPDVVVPDVFVLEAVEAVSRHVDAVAGVRLLAIGVEVRDPERPVGCEQTRWID